MKVRRDPQRGRFVDSGYRVPRGNRRGFNVVGAMNTPDLPASRAPAVKTLVLDLSTARADVVFDVSGDVIEYVNSTNLTDVVQIRFDDTNSDPVPFVPGYGWSGRRFTRLLITNAAIAAATATFAYTANEAGRPPVRIDT